MTGMIGDGAGAEDERAWKVMSANDGRNEMENDSKAYLQ